MFAEFWNNTFDGMPPVAHELKIQFADRWVRFHSLPESKRYPETEAEYQEVLSRHNQVLSELCSSCSDVYIVAPEYSSVLEPKPPGPELEGVLQNPEYWQSVPMHDPEEGEEFHSYWHLYYECAKWESGSLDRIFKQVANDELRNIMVINPTLGWVFHPYDGGADVILQNESKMQQLKNKFKGWLSAYASGW